MTFQISKILNHGSSHPVVARLQLQTFDLLGAAQMADDARDRAKTIYFEAAKRLLRCCDIRDEVSHTQAELLREIRPAENPRVIRVPHFIGLDGIVETFLYEAKNFLRDISSVFEPFFNVCFAEASDLVRERGKNGGAIQWAERTLGNDDRITLLLRAYRDSLSRIITMRNAVEHPDGRSGRLHIVNFQLADGALLPPAWYLNDSVPAQIGDDLPTICDSLLFYGEELIALLVEKKLPNMMQITEIPEAQRPKEMPKRLALTLTPELIEKLHQHIKGR